jgi:hypothetical protein
VAIDFTMLEALSASMLADEVFAPWLGRYGICLTAVGIQPRRFGTLRAANRHVNAIGLARTSQPWLCLGAL